MNKGNVVRYDGDLFIVGESTYCQVNRKVDQLVLIPFKGDNITVHVSRKFPYMKESRLDPDVCIDNCDISDRSSCVGCFNIEVVIDQSRSIDAVEYVAKDIDTFIIKKIKSCIYGVIG